MQRDGRWGLRSVAACVMVMAVAVGGCGRTWFNINPCETNADCDDGIACTHDIMTGSARGCSVACSHNPVTACADEDGEAQLLSDGAPTNQDLSDDDPERILRAVREWNRLGRMKIHTIGLKGHDVRFMRRLAKDNGGIYISRE